jgi:hypothetical protein
MDFKEIGWENVDWIGLAGDRGKWPCPVKQIIKFLLP